MLNSPLITVMSTAVRKASKGLLRDFGEVEKLQISKKGAANFVTNADLRTDKLLIEELQRVRPKFGFLTEESGIIGNPNMTQRFVIDPIDGTTNFIHAIPYFSISVAAQERKADGNWETTAGIVYDVIHDEMFMAAKKEGAMMNNQRLRVSQRTEDLLIGTTSPRKGREGYDRTMSTFVRVAESGATIRCSGSAALDLAYVAAGRLDGMWYQRLNIWDMAAGALLVQEAGGKVSGIDGNPLVADDKGSIVASSKIVYEPLQKLLLEAANA